MSKAVLLTGGAGFIGTHLCRKLIDSGYSVRVLDLRDPVRPIPRVDYIRGNVLDAKILENSCEGVDAVYHLAATVSVPLCQNQPVASYENNVIATVRVLEAVQRQLEKSGKSIRLLFSSSSAVYGNSCGPNESLSEVRALNEPASHYAAQKLASEHAIRVACRHSGVRAIVFRFFNVYGEGQDPSSPYSGVISIFSKRIGEGLSLSLNDSGAPTRDFVSAHDVVEACMKALHLPQEKCDGLPINLGSGLSVSIRSLAEEMSEIAGIRVSLENAPPREGDVQNSRANIQRAKEVLDWNPQVSLRSGLSELLRKNP